MRKGRYSGGPSPDTLTPGDHKESGKGMKKKKDLKLSIPAEDLKEVEHTLTKLIQDGHIQFIPHKGIIPESAIKGKKILDYVKAAAAYFDNMGDAELTDEKFFDLIKEDAEYLRGHFAIEKIKRWQKESLKDATGKAQDKLRRVGEVLADKRGRIPRLSETQIVAQRWEVHNKLKVAGISKIRNEAARSMRLKELFGGKTIDNVEKKAVKLLGFYTYKDLADLITAEICKVSASTVETYRKKKVKIIDGFSTPVFILKKGE